MVAFLSRMRIAQRLYLGLSTFVLLIAICSVANLFLVIMYPQLRPGGGLEELVQRAEPAGQHHQGVCAVDHAHLALVHGLHHLQGGEPGVADLALL